MFSRFSEKVKAVNTGADLASWTDEHKTGATPDELVQYEGYTSQFDNATADNVPNPSKLRGGTKNVPPKKIPVTFPAPLRLTE